MNVIYGPSGKYLDIDLSSRTWSVLEISREDQAAYLGGKGLALKIYWDKRKKDLEHTDPLGAENLLIFSMGVLLGTGAPCSARWEVVTRSPLTGLMVGSSCGGPFGEACRTAGWDGVVISGKADGPVVIRMDENGAVFESAESLWGLDTHETREKLGLTLREGEALIGPAGENLVPYANICSGHRFAGRGGVGAVMGSKNLKALVARGREYRIEPVRPAEFRKTVKKARKHILRNRMSRGYRAYGTNANTAAGIRDGFSAVHNFRDRWHPDNRNLTGEALAERYRTRHSACRHCSVLCGHKGHYPDGVLRQIPEYETMGMFGANIDNYNPDLIGPWNDLMNRLGMDTISAGGTLAWAMEAGEKGLRPTELRFGKTDNIAPVLEDIALRRGEGEELALGVRELSRRYGGEDFAIHVKGMECAAYDPRSSWGQGLSYAVHNKGGCHLGSYLIGLERLLGYLIPQSVMGKAQWVIFCEDLFTAINSLQICLFTAFGILAEPPIPRFLPIPLLKAATATIPRLAQSLMDWSTLSRLFWSVTGIPLSKNGFRKAGERINKLEKWMNGRLGYLRTDDTLPGRFLTEKETPYPGRNTVVPLGPMVDRYHRLRGYDEAGLPRTENLEKLGIKAG